MSNRKTSIMRKSRTGFTLVETMVMVALSAVLTGIVISGMAALYQYNHATESQSASQAALRNLTCLLREDVHAANAIRWNEVTSSLVLKMSPSRRIEYRNNKNHWERIDTMDDDEPIVTALGLDSSFRCESDAQEISMGNLLRMSITNEDINHREGQDKDRRTVRSDIVALVGKDRLILHD